MAVPLTGLAVLPASALACSVCIGWSDGQAVNVGFYWSALLLTLLPFALVAVIGLWVRRATKAGSRSSQERRTSA